ncbi:MAG: hypothetical protein HFG66_10055 [Hungatella sp.]|nr:hypothetical protein [Hungatella sp.]
MIRTFIQTKEFTRNWKLLGLSDDDMRRLELALLKNPETIYLITIYPKKEKDNLTKAECNNIKKMLQILEKSL